MARPRKEPEGFAAGTLTFRLGDRHRAMLDEVLAKDPKQSRAAIVRAALEEYLERHPGAA
ncbi:ribbon-helix-helix protein, CopG family [Geodermatophilus sp. URMC 62]|jgi:predicted transcriptional regulator|uniref:ribbon-helix-helix protein, CopG family n=1 Tax=Geodermatophilus sp. URMC 62 TaxID=3423414 RepID=UPI00406C4FEA